MVGKVDRIPTLPCLGSWILGTTSERSSFLLQQKFKVAKKRENGAKLDFAETRVSRPALLAKKTGSLVWSVS